REKRPLVRGVTVTSYCSLDKLSVGLFVTSFHLVEVKSEFSCRTKSVEGTVQDRSMCVSERVMFNSGAKVVCKVTISPPEATAANLLPSAEEATACQFRSGAAVANQLPPASVEM